MVEREKLNIKRVSKINKIKTIQEKNGENVT